MSAIAVIGTGYVGLSTGACLSHLGHNVVCADIDAGKVSALQEGILPIVEDGLHELVLSGLESDRLAFSIDVIAAVRQSEYVFFCLPTPQSDDGSADLSFVVSVASEISDHLQPGAIVINKSTVPVGSARMVRNLLGRPDVHVVSNPEFLRQGNAVRDFLHPSRVVIGGDDPDVLARVARLYAGIKAPILQMNTSSAEALKYAANAFLATKLTFINAMADICEAVGADIFDVAEGIGLDPRIGSDMLRAGPGWGGSCFPKDTRALVNIAADHGYDFALLRGVIETNDQHYARVVAKVIEVCSGSVDGCVIAAWGLTFKAGTDDLRDSPAIKILKTLHDSGAIIRAFDPTAMGRYESYPWIEVCADELSACEDADVLAVLTEWPQFTVVSPIDAAQRLRSQRVVDGRNVLDKDEWMAAGFEYRGVGR